MVDSITAGVANGTAEGSRAGERPALLVTNPVFREPAFGHHHPLSIRRHSTVLELCDIVGWLHDDAVRTCPLAGRELLERFHESGYLDALQEAAGTGRASTAVRERYNIGTMECPLFEGLWERAAASVGGSVLAAELALKGQVAFHPAGGTHHGRPGRASGFCYFNDPVFAILTLLDAGAARVVYADLDAHHGDGVQDAFASDPRVYTISIHETGRWPHTGGLEDTGSGRALNMPVPRGFNDAELRYLTDETAMPIIEAWGPDAAVITCGADGLKGDPLSGLALSNTALWRAVETLVELTPRAVVLGGGGYNPWTVSRCWSGLWAILSRQPIPETLPPEAHTLLSALDCDLVDEEDVDPRWLDSIADRPNDGPVRDEIAELAAAVLRRDPVPA